MKKGKKGASAHGPGPHLESSNYEFSPILVYHLKARSSMRFSTGSRSSRCEIQNSAAMLEVCRD